jgi:phenylpyruvate tautomerase PptA (4-oxalocrotonate tautomerase family)
MIDVIYSKGALNREQREAIAARLTDIVMEVAGTKGNAAFASGTWLVLHETDESAFFVGGKPSSGRYRVSIDAPAGGFDSERKAEVIRRITDAILQIEGVTLNAAERARVYCLINDIAEGGFGFAGQVITLERLKALLKDSKR